MSTENNFLRMPPRIHVTRVPVVIATHNGSFHMDDVWGVAVLRTVFPNNRVIRTRDANEIATAHFAVDVGGEWDAQSGRFDHHQKGFTGKRDNGVVYASAGLVWAAFGEHVLAPWSERLTPSERTQVVREIDEELVQHIDRADTGAAMGAPGLFGLSALMSQHNLTWDEERALTPSAREAWKMDCFIEAVEVAQRFIERIVTNKVSETCAAKHVRESKTIFDGRVLVLSEPGLPWYNVVIKELPEVLFVVYPDSSDDQFQIRTVPVESESFVARADLPAAWAGLRGAELAAACGVPDAVFCHNGRFIGGAYSQDGALRMAELALAGLSR